MSQKTIIVLCGLPFSGKSTIATSLITRGGVVLSRDQIVEALLNDPVKELVAKNIAEQISEPFSKAFETREANILNDARTILYVQEMVGRIKATDAQTIICDGTHLQVLSRAFIQEFPDYHRKAIAVKTSPETCVKRLAESQETGFRATVTPEMIRRLSLVAEWPTKDEGFDEIQEV